MIQAGSLPGGPVPGADSLRAVLDSVFAAPAYRWVEPPRWLTLLGSWWDALRGALAQLESTHPDLFQLIFVGLLLILAAIFLHAGWIVFHTIRASRAPAPGRGAAIPTTRGAGWYRAEARRLAGEGRFPEAMQADFLALVLDLDARRVVRFHPSKTPAEYAADPGLGGGARPAFRELVQALYGYAFARRPCGPDDYAAWLQAAQPDRYAAAH